MLDIHIYYLYKPVFNKKIPDEELEKVSRKERGINMYEYYCTVCNVVDLSCEIEPKKKCPKCNYLMFVEEIYALPFEEIRDTESLT